MENLECRTKIVSFSGIDGAGKSTQIQALKSWLLDAGLHVSTRTLWGDVVVWRSLREYASRRAFRGDQGIGSPEKPQNRRDKNVTSWPLTVVRCCLYLSDAIHLRFLMQRIQRRGTRDIVIFDRYIYDELANLPLHRASIRAFVRMLLGMAPAPDAAFLIDAAPEAARARKPEYPLDFLRRNRRAYLDLSNVADGIVIVEAGPIDQMIEYIRAQLLSKLSQSEAQGLLQRYDVELTK